MNKNRANLLRFFLLPVLLLRCSESPLIVSRGNDRLNSPSSIVLIPGTDLAIVANANVNLSEPSGTIVAIDLATEEVLVDTALEIPNFAGEMEIDSVRKRLFIPDHDEALLVYSYEIPGTQGEPISFSPLEVTNPVEVDDRIIENGIQTDRGPSDALHVLNTDEGDVVLVANDQGTISVVDAQTLKLIDMDSDETVYGLRLVSAANFENFDRFPGAGASRMSVDMNGLIYITSPSNNQIYILDPDNFTIEGAIDLTSISSPVVGIREIVFDDSGIAYVAHSGLDSIIVLDISQINRNGIPYEMIAPIVLGIIPVGDGPEDLELNAAFDTLYVSNQNEDSIYVIDTQLQIVLQKTYLDEGKSPGRLILDESRNRLYSLDFFSNTITIINATTGERIGDIQ